MRFSTLKAQLLHPLGSSRANFVPPLEDTNNGDDGEEDDSLMRGVVSSIVAIVGSEIEGELGLYGRLKDNPKRGRIDGFFPFLMDAM